VQDRLARSSRFYHHNTGDPKKLEIRCGELKANIASEGKVFSQDVREQLRLAVLSVFRSWSNPRAVTYRRLHDIPEDAGTAVNVEMMVFGNRWKHSGTAPHSS
jgi:pyruvate,orthophosphate dikinase